MYKNQRGFSVLEAIILLLVLLLLILGGWYVWQKNKKDDSANKAPAEQSAQQAPNEEPNNQTYLTIQEWGVRFKTVPANQDAYYVIENGKPDYAYLSLTSLKNVDNCSADDVTLGVFTRFKKDEKDPNSDELYLAAYPNAPKVGEYYFIFNQPQAYCTEDATVQAKVEAAQAAFKGSVVTVEATP